MRHCFKSSNRYLRMVLPRSQDTIDTVDVPITPPLRGSRRQAKADAVGGEAARRPGIDIFSIMNIDRQDRQDEQDERFLREKLARPMIRCGLADAQDYKTPDS